jgi:predicted nucleotidyltransferase
MRIKDFKNNIAYHSRLNTKAWAGTQLRPEVRYKLLQAAKLFISYLDVEGFRVLDVVLAGSMANFNYTDYSDFDVHVVTRYSDLNCDNLAEAFYRAKKQLWNEQHDIIVYGHDVELYAEDIDQPPVSAGIYSILDDKWLVEPKYNPPEIDRPAIKLKVQDLTKQIDHAVSTANDPDDILRVADKISKMRKSGLAQGGEFSVENLAFKVLRNQGLIDRLYKEFNRQQDINLSL